MTTDERIDEVLKAVREQGARLEGKDEELQKLVLEQREWMIEERKLNNSRFSQLSAGLNDVRKEVGQVKVEMTQTKVELNAKIDRFYDSLSQDIQAFAGDLQHLKLRATRPEKKKSLS